MEGPACVSCRKATLTERVSLPSMLRFVRRRALSPRASARAFHVQALNESVRRKRHGSGPLYPLVGVAIGFFEETFETKVPQLARQSVLVVPNERRDLRRFQKHTDKRDSVHMHLSFGAVCPGRLALDQHRGDDRAKDSSTATALN